MSKKSTIPPVETTTTVTKIYRLYVYPIRGVSEERAREIAEKAGHELEFEGNYELARETARAISELGGVRRVDIRQDTTTVKSSLTGAYSVGAYMTDRSDPAMDYHYKSGNAPPETKRARKQAKLAQKQADLERNRR